MESGTGGREGACPACGAFVRSDAEWCGQCYASLRPPPPPPPPPVPQQPAPLAAYGYPALDPLADLVPDSVLASPAAPATGTPDVEPAPDAPAAATWPCAACGADNALDLTVCGVCQVPFLAAVRDATAPRLELPVVGNLLALSRGRRLALAAGVVALLLVPLAVLTLLLTGSPPPDPASEVPASPGVVQQDGVVPPATP